METATAQSYNQPPDCVTTIYGNGRYLLKWRLMGQILKKQLGAELYPFMEMVFAKVE